MSAVSEFLERVSTEWWPTFSNARGYAPDRLDITTKSVSERDAADFLRALKLMTISARGEFRMPMSKASEVIFWDGYTSSGRIPLWIEPIVTIAGIARLHLDFGWPVEQLGMQSEKWEFDLTAFGSDDMEHEVIAGEVKASSKQIDVLLSCISKCCAREQHDCRGANQAQLNAHRKWSGLHRSKARVFWALGPDCDSRVFSVAYGANSQIALKPVGEEYLKFASHLRKL